MKLFRRKIAALAAAVWIASAPFTVHAQDWTYNGESINTTAKTHVIGSPDQEIDNNHILINDINLNATYFSLVTGVNSGKVGSLKNNTITINNGTFHYGRLYSNILMQERVPIGAGYGNDIIINGGTFIRDKDFSGDGGGYGIMTYAGDIIVNDGNFSGDFHFDTVGKIEIHDGTFSNLLGINANEIIIDGGTFDGYHSSVSFGEKKYFTVGKASEWKHYGNGTIMDKYDISITGGTFNAGMMIEGCNTGSDYTNIIDRRLTIKNVDIPYIVFHSPNGANFTDVSFDNINSKVLGSGFLYYVDNINVKDSDLSGSTEFRVQKDLSFKNSTSEGEITFGKNLVFDNSTHDSGEDKKINIINNANTPKTITLKNGSHVTGKIDHHYISDAKTTLSMTESSVFTGNITTESDMLVDLKDGSKLDGNLLINTYSRSANDQLKVDSSEITGNVSIDGGFDLNNAHIGGTFEAYKYSTLAIEDKTLRIKDSTIDGAVGVITKGNGTSKIENTTLNISGSTLGDSLTAFQAANVDNSVINITGSSITGDILGFKGVSNYTSNGITNSTMTIDEGSTIGGNVYLTNSYKSINNTLNLYSMAGLNENTVISGNGYASTGNSSGNTLNIKNVLGATAKNLEKWQNINIYVPATANIGDTVLTLTDTNGTNLSGTTVKAGIEGDIDFNTGDKIYLLTNANGITTNNATTYGTLTSGVSTIYTGLAVKKDGDNSIILTIPAADPPAPPVDPDPPVNPDPPVDPDPPVNPPANPDPPVNPPAPAPVIRRVNPQIFSLNAGQAASLELVQQGRELATQIRHAETTDNGIFGVIGASFGKREDINTKYQHYVAGWKQQDEEKTAAAYAWYGRGNYDTDIAGIDASGSASAIGVGGLYRQALPEDMFIEGQLGFGQVSRDYSGHGFSTVIDSTSYDGKSPYFTGAITFGKSWTISEEVIAEDMLVAPKDKIEAYLTVAHDRINGFNAKLSSGESFDFGDVSQTTIGVGCTYEKDMGHGGTLYAGIEVNKGIGGAAEATYRNGSTGELDLNGITAELNLGWKQELKDGQSINIALHGLTGERQGGAIDILYSKAI